MAPIPAATFAARYIQSQDRPPAERMESLVAVANLATRLPGRTARLWAERVGAIAGPAAVAEAHERLLNSLEVEAPKPAHQVDLTNWQPEPATQQGAFEAVTGPGATEALIERIATWGRRLPCVADPGFIRSASASIDAAGSLGATDARARLHELLGRIERSIGSQELATHGPTTEAIGL